MKMKRHSEALLEFDSIISSTQKDIYEAGVEKYAYKAYHRKAELMLDMLWFSTALSNLEKAEELIKEYEKST